MVISIISFIRRFYYSYNIETAALPRPEITCIIISTLIRASTLPATWRLRLPALPLLRRAPMTMPVARSRKTGVTRKSRSSNSLTCGQSTISGSMNMELEDLKSTQFFNVYSIGISEVMWAILHDTKLSLIGLSTKVARARLDRGNNVKTYR